LPTNCIRVHSRKAQRAIDGAADLEKIGTVTKVRAVYSRGAKLGEQRGKGCSVRTFEPAEDGERHHPVLNICACGSAKLLLRAEDVVEIVSDLEKESESFSDTAPSIHDRYVFSDQHRAEFAAKAENGGGLEFHDPDTLVGAHRGIAETQELKKLSATQTPRCSGDAFARRSWKLPDQGQRNFDEMEPASCGRSDAQNAVERRNAAADFAAIHHIIMEERPGMDEFDGRCRAREVGARREEGIARGSCKQKPRA